MNRGNFMRGLSSARSGVAALTLALAMGMIPEAAAEDLPFVVSVDGQRVDESAAVTDAAKATDAGLQSVDIQVKFDGLGVKPVLNVSTFPPQVHYQPGEPVRFLASLNYAAWVKRGEIRIYDRSAGSGDQPYQVLPLNERGTAEWLMPDDAPADMDYVLRVYDGEGRYDETRSLPLGRSTSKLGLDEKQDHAVAPGFGEDRTALRNISVYGGAVTVYGKNIPEGHEVRIAGETVPVDGKNSFVVQRIYPAGHQAVDVSVMQDGQGLTFTRDFEIPENEWFYVALADFTAGMDLGKGIIEHAASDQFDKIWTRGRLAFYLKGKIKGQYILTASADTGEGKLATMFKGLDGKSPQDVLRRIDPNTYYPVYGDDSTAVNDAPTNGKFYVRLEKGPSSIMWGNFRSTITGTHFLRSQRALYGADGVYHSEAITANGDAKRSVEGYAALPGTLPQSDVFRGTGGSAYFLKHKDVTVGSETVAVEVRNAITGWVVGRSTLTRGTDYTIDSSNGVIILSSPLPSTLSNGNENYLTVNYEFTPTASDVKGYVLGGRGETWLGDHVRVGVTGLREKTTGADQKMAGVDVRVQSTPNTYVEGEVARSSGPGFGSSYSADGGLSLQTNASAGVAGKTANAWRVESGVSLGEVTKGKVEGHVAGRYENYQAGFSSLDVQAPKAKTLWGFEGEAKPTANSAVKAHYSEINEAGGNLERQGEVAALAPLSAHVTVEPYARYTEEQGSATAASHQGVRADVGTKLAYTWDADRQVYVFAQKTVARSNTMLSDDRVGIGGKKKITDKIAVSGEISEGGQGLDATAAVSYDPTPDNRYYVGYRLDAARANSSTYGYTLSGQDMGTLVVGAKHRFNDQWSAFGEDNTDLFGERRSLTQTYGVTYTPAPEWTIEGASEIGMVYDHTINTSTLLKNPDLKREAGSLSVGYHLEDAFDAKGKGEVRHDDASDGSTNVTSYLAQGNVSARVSEDWRALAKIDAVIATASDDSKKGEYVEGSLGFAYRPTLSDRLNFLAKYQFVYDAPGGDQVGIDGTTSSPWQQSHIFSVDGSYDVNHYLSLGAKYGFRIGEEKDRTAGAKWEMSQAHLGIIRADVHIVHAWDAMAEARMLWSPTTNSRDVGFVAAVYRQFGDNFKVGIGYNFGVFSDDLRDLVHDDHGVFLNVIGKF